ncbi:prepilin-type N-terminal cleavage/methylation domain-containing protein [uncultured Endozoicomonas sp.]|uniref:prepilin-type N-terminal cleavage/methylation domain-containing protein n=1 Tax=uncultured Endozoicomonas sp. TaxID=432652 RepID=UPI00262CAD82|nr:prepilin-type N-terminal cleavage/methylation domain-containing protein [uncultured Endozoicomonas sp.]
MRQRTPGNPKGFTLIEILVVIVIIGVLLGITLLSPITRSFHSVMQNEASRLESLFYQARDRAMLDNLHYGFSVIDGSEYNWWVLPAESLTWQLLEEAPFKPYVMPETMSLRLESPESSNLLESEDDKPSIVFYRDFQTTPFLLRIIPTDRKQAPISLSTDGLSDLQRVRE